LGAAPFGFKGAGSLRCGTLCGANYGRRDLSCRIGWPARKNRCNDCEVSREGSLLEVWLRL